MAFYSHGNLIAAASEPLAASGQTFWSSLSLISVSCCVCSLIRCVFKAYSLSSFSKLPEGTYGENEMKQLCSWSD